MLSEKKNMEKKKKKRKKDLTAFPRDSLRERT